MTATTVILTTAPVIRMATPARKPAAARAARRRLRARSAEPRNVEANFGSSVESACSICSSSRCSSSDSGTVDLPRSRTPTADQPSVSV